jgi:hypothetical protein
MLVSAATEANRRSADVSFSSLPYLHRPMQASSYQQVVLRRPDDPCRVFCTMCEHSEFVHGDYEARRCLYSECGCSGFTLGAGA